MINDEGKVNFTFATNLTAGEVVTATATSTSEKHLRVLGDQDRGGRTVGIAFGGRGGSRATL